MYDFYLDGVCVIIWTTMRDLGVNIDSTFEFSPHIYDICRSTFRILGLIIRTARHGLRSSAVKFLYKSLVLQIFFKFLRRLVTLPARSN